MQHNLPIYLINLDSRIDRLSHSKNQAMKHGIPFERVSAVVPEEPLPFNTLISAPAFACLQSHLKALRTFLQTSESHALILEDDFQILKPAHFKIFIESRVFEHYDFVQLGFLQMGLRHRIDLFAIYIEHILIRMLSQFLKIIGNKNLVKRLRLRRIQGIPRGFLPDDIRSGAHCYVVSRNFAQTILFLNNPAFLTIDSLYGTLPWNHHFRMIRTTRSWVDQTDSKSSIKISAQQEGAL